MKNRNKDLFLTLIGLAALAVIVYLPAFGSGYLLDDNILIRTNPFIRDAGNIPKFFFSQEARMPKDFSNLRGDIYRPLQLISYTISHALWKEDVRFYHAENVLLHIINGLFLYVFLWFLFKDRIISAIGASLFLVHPIQVEAVTYLSGRADLMGTFFFITSLLAGLLALGTEERRSGILRILSILLFALALLSKEMAVTLPLILGLYVLFFSKEGSRVRFTSAMRLTSPYFITLFVYWALRTVNLGKIAQTSLPQDIFFKMSVMGQVFFGYLKLIVFPARLTFFHDFDINFIRSNLSAAIDFLPIVLYLAVCVFMYKKDKKTSFFLSAYFIALLPVSNIVPIKAFMQERFLYLPFVFIIMALARIYIILPNARKTVIAVFSLAIAFYSTLTFARNIDWKDQATFMKKEMSLHPEQGVFYFDFGHSSFMAGKYDEAIGYLEKASARKLSDIYRTRVYDTLGNCYMEKGDYGKAVECYTEALKTTPNYVFALNSIGNIYFKQGRYKDSMDYFYAALRIWPDSALFNKNFGSANMLNGNNEEAIKYWKRSLELNNNQPDVAEFIQEAQTGEGNWRRQ